MTDQKKKNDDIIYTKENKVGIIMINREDRHNAIDHDCMVAMADAIEDAGKDESLGAAILCGAGKSFCAGADFGGVFEKMLDISYGEWQKLIVEPMIRIYKGIANMPKPVIVAIQGYAVGGGVDIASACDIRIAATDAKFGEVFVKNAINPEACVFFMPRLIGLGRALLYSFTGELMNAEEAERFGLVEKIVAPEELMPTARKIAEKLANGPTVAIAAIKRLMRDALETNNLDITLQTAFDSIYRLIKTEDFHEIVTAFGEKRKPVYKGK